MGHKFRPKKAEGDGICDFCGKEGDEVAYICTRCEDGDGDYCSEECFLKSHQKLCGKTMADCKKAGHRMRSKKLRSKAKAKVDASASPEERKAARGLKKAALKLVSERFSESL